MILAGFGSAMLAAVVSAAAAAPAPQLDPDVVAVVNGEAIRLADLDRALFLDDQQQYAKRIRPFLIQERVVKQKMSEKGISVTGAQVDEYMRDLDRALKTRQRTSLRAQLQLKGMSEEFFRRTARRTLGLFYLAGGRGNPFKEMREPATSERMNSLLKRLVDNARVEVDPEKLPPETAAVVNGEKISIAEAGRVARLGLSEKTRRERIKVLIYYFLARQELRRRKLEFTRDDLEFQIHLASAAKATRFGEREFPLERILEKLGRDLEQLKREYGFRTVAMLTKMVRPRATEEELRKRFESDGASFGNGVPKASHIFIRTVGRDGKALPARELRERKKLAQEIYRKIVEEHQDFAKLAGEHSEDPRTSSLGGNLGFLPPSKVRSDAAARAAYRLKVGEVCPPVFGQRGWHIVKVTEINRTTFKAAKPAVMAATVAAYRRKLLKSLQEKATVRLGPAAKLKRDGDS
jgi:parvulin-like peptidyl-prolyl isomerase